jgi:hydrogenase maturation protein HypF
VRGRVQGVGFRPFVWRLAMDAGLKGHVLNDGAGVTIAAWGTHEALDQLLQDLKKQPPLLAVIEEVTTQRMNGQPPAGEFQILHSEDSAISAEITPDASTCGDCLSEIRDPEDRRYLYPFTNCTHCGPRLSIVTGIPYDRTQTSMRKFDMCADCLREYHDPTDRRFHAQPNACPACGPKIWLEEAQGKISCADPLTETAQRLMQGQIIAIKGIGGFHLACDATDVEAVQRLRDRKNRKAKPFAIMAKDTDQIRDFCHLSETEADLLTTPTAPIVLLKTRHPLPGIAPCLNRLGVMLPHTPLHHLLMAQVEGPLVMTSGNPSNTPQVTQNAQARSALAHIADTWLMHDRDIVNRLDDSLMRLDQGGPSILRRGRGLVPAPIPLPAEFADAPPTLGLGAELKSTFCLLNNGQATPSQHIGDLTTAETFADFRAKIALFSDLYDFAPQVIAVDLHPDYLSTRWGTQLAKETGAGLVQVQHHHAHMVSCLAENQIAPDDALSVGLVLDGTGLGTDGTIWGGEILLGDYYGFARKAHVQPVALPGGEQAVREPWRNLVAHLIAAFGADWEHQIAGTPVSARLAAKPTALIDQMIMQGVNAPLASSTGRLFDAVAAALGVTFDQQCFEGQAAMELEAMIGDLRVSTGYPADVLGQNTLSWTSLWSGLIADLKSDVDPATIAARFHLGLADVLVDTVTRIAADAKTYRVVLSGGVMQNRFLLHALTQKLQAQGLTVLRHKTLPANDGGIALGQACCAALNHAPKRHPV